MLSNQIRVEYGQLRPCCWFTESVDVTDVEAVKAFQKDIAGITDWESTRGRCIECKIREKKRLFSPRLQSNEQRVFQGVEDDSKVSIEIQIDKDCNGACLICGPWNSTTWEKYENKIKSIPIKDVEDPKIASSEFIKKLTQSIDFSSAKEILFLGGEPLRTNSHIRLLETVKNPENTIVNYTSNGSYIPDSETLEVWSRFKMICLTFSIDGIGEHFNYLRWPLQWNQVENNLRYFLDLKNLNIKLNYFSYTTTPFSLFYHDRYVEWAHRFFENTHLDAVKMFGRPWQPRGNTPMALGAIPIELQGEIKSKYGVDHAITRLLEPFSNAQYNRFMEYIRHHDKHRQHNWRDVFPEMTKFYK